MLLLLLIIGIVCNGQLKGLLDSVFSRSERVYGIQAQTIGNAIMTWLFRLGILALTISILSYTGGAFLWITYIKALAAVVVVYVLQMLLVRWIGWVFVTPKVMDIALEQYHNLRMLACYLLYPVLLIVINWPNTLATYILLGIIFLLFTVAFIWKGIQLFYTKPLSILYILIFFVSLEIIPLAAVYNVHLLFT